MPNRQSPEPTWFDFARELGHNLKRARQRRGLSQERVAHLAGLASFTYQKYEKGESKPGTPMNPELKSLVALSQALEVPLLELLPKEFPDMTSGR
ncbi:helix-turn-helix domain-containing protein [Nocardioides sp.]|uniref:helix-turn-helix domain-containing protein n=1 Tax=Nocardioides sp. TaxID=35761 RepID=UPI0039E6CFC9